MSELGGDTEAAPASLQALLARLADGDDGAAAYERLRARLGAFFRLRFPAQAEALADETLDRLARRLAEGVPVDSPAGYALGIARRLLLETGARQQRELQAALDAFREAEAARADDEPDPALPALRRCLDSIGPEAAAFILEYYALDGGASRIEHRQQFAERLGLSQNALRNRALRMRLALERCVRQRLGHEPDRPNSGHRENSRSSRDETARRHTRQIMDDDRRR